MKKRILKCLSAAVVLSMAILFSGSAFAEDNCPTCGQPLPEGTVLDEAGEEVKLGDITEVGSGVAKPTIAEMEDGKYAIKVDAVGGSGKVTVTSPTTLIIENGYAYAEIVWSSDKYDYMVVDGEKFLPINEEGYSTFKIPITRFDSPMDVVGDTTAMSVAHEVHYDMTFYYDEITSLSKTPQAAAKRSVLIAVGIVVLCIIQSSVRKYRKKRR